MPYTIVTFTNGVEKAFFLTGGTTVRQEKDGSFTIEELTHKGTNVIKHVRNYICPNGGSLKRERTAN